MSIRFVGSTVTRLHLTDPYSPEDLSGKARAAVEDHVFTDYLTPTAKGLRSGFVRPSMPLTLPVDVSDTAEWIVTSYITLTWRLDDKKVPPKRLKARVEEMTRAWCRENSRERCPALVKSEMKEQAELEMLPRCMSTSKVVNIVWNVHEGWILLSTQSAKHVDALRKLLHRSFGIVTTIVSPDEGLDEPTLALLADTKPLFLASVTTQSPE